MSHMTRQNTLAMWCGFLSVCAAFWRGHAPTSKGRDAITRPTTQSSMDNIFRGETTAWARVHALIDPRRRRIARSYAAEKPTLTMDRLGSDTGPPAAKPRLTERPAPVRITPLRPILSLALRRVYSARAPLPHYTKSDGLGLLVLMAGCEVVAPELVDRGVSCPR